MGGFYAGRVRCYLAQALGPTAGGRQAAVNVTAYFGCVDGLARSFQAQALGDAAAANGSSGVRALGIPSPSWLLP